MARNDLDEIYPKLKAWAAQAVHAAQNSDLLKEPWTCHLDTWLEGNKSSIDKIKLSCRLYELLIDETKHLEYEVKPFLRIPLTPSETLDTKIPSLADIYVEHAEHDHFNRESPEFYVFNRELYKYMNPTEQYIFPVNYGLFQKYTSNIFTYYHTSRGKIYIDNNWEYNRNIFVEYYPDAWVRS